MLFVVITLILAGLALMLVEVVFIPGTTVVGLLGLGFTVVGVVVSFNTYGTETGLYVLLGTGLMTAAMLYLSFRHGAWNRFSLKTSISSKVNEGLMADLKVGDAGIALSTLRPVGKAEFNRKTFEVTTYGDYIASGKRVRIIELKPNQITVEPID